MKRREYGARREFSGGKRHSSHLPTAFNTASSVEVRINSRQVEALSSIFASSPTLQAAKNVLHAQVLSGGLSLQRDAATVEMQPAFRRHVEQHWAPFAKSCIDSVLTLGFVVVAFEEAERTRTSKHVADPARRGLGKPQPAPAKSKQPDKQRLLAHLNKADDVDKADADKAGKVGKTDRLGKGSKQAAADDRTYMVPIVPAIGTYELAFDVGGRSGFGRTYKVYNSSTGAAVDTDCRVFVSEHPDANGNVSSPVSSVFDLASFVETLIEFAVVAETERSRPTLVTQARRQQGAAGGISPNDMYFDRESESASSALQRRVNTRAAGDLNEQLNLCGVLNAAQTRASHGGGRAQLASSAVGASARRSFALPTDQELASQQMPTTRTDLVDLMRTATDHMCAAIGVPAGLVFDGRYATQSSTQLSLLNATVGKLVNTVNTVLTQVYADIYGSDLDSQADSSGCPTELVVTPSPLAALPDIATIYAAGLADFEVAAPLAMHAVGTPASTVDAAMERYYERCQTELQLLHWPQEAATNRPLAALRSGSTEAASDAASDVGSASDRLAVATRRSAAGVAAGEGRTGEERVPDTAADKAARLLTTVAWARRARRGHRRQVQ